jgi:hypothetical protein
MPKGQGLKGSSFPGVVRPDKDYWVPELDYDIFEAFKITYPQLCQHISSWGWLRSDNFLLSYKSLNYNKLK